MQTTTRRTAFSFRARLVIVMTALLLVTLGLVQYLNQRAQHEVQQSLEQQKANVNSTFFAHLNDIRQANDLVLTSFAKTDYMFVLLEQPEYAAALNRDRIRHVLVVRDDGVIVDSSERELFKKTIRVPGGAGGVETGSVEPGNAVAALDGDVDDSADTYWTRIKTTEIATGATQYVWMAIVVSNRQVNASIDQSQRDLADVVESTASTRLRLTLGVFALAVALTILLVWRFTRPIQQLSNAAERVAKGDLDFTVDIHRRDEMGQLARTFNEMIGGLKAKAQLEERLNNTERAAVIGRLTSAIAHEIRNPLNFITLSIDHVKSKFPPADPQERETFSKLLSSIKEETGRLNRLVTDVLNFGRPAKLHVRSFDLRDAVDQVLGIVRPQADQQMVEIETSVPEHAVPVVADMEKLKSALSNIAINALQAMPTGGTMRLSLVPDTDGVRISIADTGQGIPEAELDRVFEPYYSTKETGTGLGLAVTKKIVDEHGGRIRVESVLGEGTTFEIVLPQSASSERVAATVDRS